MTTPDLDAVVLPPLPAPWDYCYIWIGPYGACKFSIAPHNGRQCDEAVSIYIESHMQSYATAAVLADRDRRAAPSEGAMRFAGWFREIPSAMNYRLWEQGGPEQNPDGRDVALYERREP